MDKHIDEFLHLVRKALIESAESDFRTAGQLGLSERDAAIIVVQDAITHILRGAMP